MSSALSVIEGGALANLPAPLARLQSYGRYVCWDPAELNLKGRQVKAPRRCDDPNKYASTRRPWTWKTWQALQAVQLTNPNLRAGYVLTQDDEHVFIDLDGCRDPESGAIAEWAQQIVDICKSYTEITPSGRGLRIIGLASNDIRSVTATVPAHLLPGGPPPPTEVLIKSQQIEVYYFTPRFVTMTGWRLNGTQDWDLQPIGEMAQEIVAFAPPKSEDRKTNDTALASDDDNAVCATIMPNPPSGVVNGPDDTWDTFTTIGMAFFAASGGSQHGLACFRHWSQKHPKHEDVEVLDRWDHWAYSGPDRLTAGTLKHHAKLEAYRQGQTLRMPSHINPPGGWPPVEGYENALPLQRSIADSRTSLNSDVPSGDRNNDSVGKIIDGEYAVLHLADNRIVTSADSDSTPAVDTTLQGLPPPLVPIPPFAPALPQKPEQPLFELLSPKQLMARYGHEPDFLVHGLLTRGSTFLLTGLPGAGKSPLVQDLIVKIAMGAPWCGRKTKQAKCIYIAGESARQTTLNLAHFACGVIEQASGLDHGEVAIEQGLDEIESNILAIDNTLTLEADTERLIKSVQAVFAEGAPWEGDTPGIFALDTLRAISSGSVSSDEDMSVVQAAIGLIRSVWPLAVIIVIHHAAKGAPALSSGSNRLDGLAETITAITMLPPGEGKDFEGIPLQRLQQFGPCPRGFRYASLRLVMGRNKTWENMEPIGLTLAVQGSMIRICYDNESTSIWDASRACLQAGQGVFKDERPQGKPGTKKKVVAPLGTPIEAVQGDDGAFAGVEITARKGAANTGAATVDHIIVQWLTGTPVSSAEIMAMLTGVKDDMDEETRKSSGVDSGKNFPSLLRKKLNVLRTEGRIVDKGEGNIKRWYKV